MIQSVMDFEEYSNRYKALSEKEREIIHEKSELVNRYIRDHEPLHLKKYQHIEVRLEVTQNTRNRLTQKACAMPAYALGHKYTVKGVFLGYKMTEKGVVFPWLMNCRRMIAYDRLIDIKLSKNQPQGDCRKCLFCRNGYCYPNGRLGDDLDFADHQIENGDIVCPKYEEVIQGGFSLRFDPEKHYPNVTMVKNTYGNTIFRIYTSDWRSYTQWSKDDVRSLYVVPSEI